MGSELSWATPPQKTYYEFLKRRYKVGEAGYHLTMGQVSKLVKRLRRLGRKPVLTEDEVSQVREIRQVLLIEERLNGGS